MYNPAHSAIIVHKSGCGWLCTTCFRFRTCFISNHNVSWGRTHYSYVIMGMIAYQITSFTIVYSIVYSGADQRKYQSSASLAFVREIHRWLVNAPHKGPVTRKMFLFGDVIMRWFLVKEKGVMYLPPNHRGNYCKHTFMFGQVSSRR